MVYKVCFDDKIKWTLYFIYASARASYNYDKIYYLITNYGTPYLLFIILLIICGYLMGLVTERLGLELEYELS